MSCRRAEDVCVLEGLCFRDKPQWMCITGDSGTGCSGLGCRGPVTTHGFGQQYVLPPLGLLFQQHASWFSLLKQNKILTFIQRRSTIFCNFFFRRVFRFSDPVVYQRELWSDYNGLALRQKKNKKTSSFVG